MRYPLKQIHCRPWLLNGLSLKLIESHYENNYCGALRRLNAITEQLQSLDFAAAGYLVNGLKRERLVDVRPRFYVFRTQDIADGATWSDPERVEEWIGELSKSDPVIVYCAYGFHVGCGTTVKLREAGFDAKYMEPGHSGWKAVGGPIRLHP